MGKTVVHLIKVIMSVIKYNVFSCVILKMIVNFNINYKS